MPSWWCCQRPAKVIEEDPATIRKTHRSAADSRLHCDDAAADTAAVIAVRSEPTVGATAVVLQPIGGQQTCLRQCELRHQSLQQQQQKQRHQHPSQQQLHQDHGLQAVQPDNSSSVNIQFHVPFGELAFHQVIGQGSFKIVYRGRWRNTHVAIVSMRKGGLVTEARLMQKLSTHPNLVQFHRWSQDTQGNEYILLELMPLGSLDKILLRFGVVLRTSMKMSMAEQIAAAMAELSSEGVLHRDLAVRNVLVQSLEPVHVKVADFGLAQQLSVNATANNTSNGRQEALLLSNIPVRWCPPEVLIRQAWGVASDVWAFGVTLWEIFADGAEPYATLTDLEVAQFILAGGRLPRPPRCPREVYSLMTQCWAADPTDRPRFDDILSTFSVWRQKHAKQAQVAQQCGNIAASAPISSSPVRGSLELPRHLTSSSMQEGMGLSPVTSVHRRLSEPLPAWDLNQHIKAVLQLPAAASAVHRSAGLAAVRESWASGAQMMPSAGTLDNHSSVSSVASRGAPAALLDVDNRCGWSTAADAGWPAGHVKALATQQKQQVAELLCCASLSRQSSGNSCLSQVSASRSSSFVGGSDYLRYLDSISEDGQSVELSFEIEELIDPNVQQEPEDLAHFTGTWEFVPHHPTSTHTTANCALGSLPPPTVGLGRNNTVLTALAGNICQAMSRQVAEAGVACVTRCNEYVDVRSLAYGGEQAASNWPSFQSSGDG